MKARALTSALCVGLYLAAPPEVAQADVMLGVLAGAGRGTMTKDAAETLSASFAQAYMGYSFGQLDLHGFVQHMDVAYKEGDEAYVGIYSLTGVGAMFSTSFGKAGRLTTTVQSPLTGSIVALSESKGTVNDTPYIYSTLTTLTATPGVQAMIGYERIAVGRMESKAGERAYLGFYAGYLNQSFTSRKTKIKTNNSVMSPQSPGTEKVAYSLNLLSFAVGFNYNM